MEIPIVALKLAHNLGQPCTNGSPKVLAAFEHVMGTDFKVNSLNARLPLRTQGHQDLHVDWGT